MDLKSYLTILSGNKWVIITIVVTTVAVATLITFMITPIYTASATLRVATASSGVSGTSDFMYADRLMNTYTKIATTGPVLRELVGRLNLKVTPKVKVEAIPNTELIKITVESSDPSIAKNSANTLAEILIAQGKELYTGSGKSAQEILGEQLKQAEDELNQARQNYDTYVSQNPKDTAKIDLMNQAIQLKEKTYSTLLDQYDQARLRETIRANILSVVEPALLPSNPSKPNKVMNIALGFIVGLVGGVGLAFFFESFGTRLYSSRQIEVAAELNVIGKIPIVQKRRLLKWQRSNIDSMWNTAFKEAFRQLQVKLSMVNLDKLDGKPIRTLMVTSSEPSEGKSTIITNLAIAIAQSGKKVIVIDCDLHIPNLHKIMGLPNEFGLSSVLSGEMMIEEAVQVTQFPEMCVLTSGPLPADPAKLLSSPQLKSLIIGLAEQYDIVLLDTPAMLAVAETAILTSIVEGVLLVVRRNFIKEDAFREALRHLVEIKARMIGIIINNAEINGTHYYYRNRKI